MGIFSGKKKPPRNPKPAAGKRKQCPGCGGAGQQVLIRDGQTTTIRCRVCRGSGWIAA